MHNYKWWSVFSSGLVLLTVLLSAQAIAVVNVDKTRIVFNANEIAQSINLVNSEHGPVVLQIWTDNGDIHALPEQSKTPVLAIPPVLKIQPGELRSLKLMLTSRAGLKAGKETLYWLNLYQIPALRKSDNAHEQKVVLPLRLRLKVFVRPAGLGAPHSVDAKKFILTRLNNALLISNPTPWHMSMNIKFSSQERVKDILISPLSSLSIPVKSPLLTGKSIDYDVIGDSGFSEKHQAVIQ